MRIVTGSLIVVLACILAAGVGCAENGASDPAGLSAADQSAPTDSPKRSEGREGGHGGTPGAKPSPAGKDRVDAKDGIREMALEEVVVTATRKEMILSDAPGTVTVVDSKELETSALKNVDDVLRAVAGVDVWGNSLDPLGHRAVSVRGVGGGSSQERTLILVDGIPINDSWSGSIAWGQIAKEDIDRIEVVKGAASGLYGTHAMGGVINIITKVPPMKPFGVTLKGSYGELNTWYAYGNTAGRVFGDRAGYYLSAKRAATDGYMALQDPTIPNLSRSDYDRTNAMGQFFWYPDQYSFLKVSGTHFYEERHREFKLSEMGPNEINRGHATYRRDVPDGLSWLVSAYGHDEYMKNLNDDRMTHSYLERISEYEKPFYGFLIQPSKKLASWNTLTVGTEFKYSQAQQEDTYLISDRRTQVEGSQWYLGLYAQDEIYLFCDRLILIPGARFDLWESFDGHAMDTAPKGIPAFDENYESKQWNSFNPKFSSVYHLTDSTTLRASIGTGYRAPSPSELYASSTYGLSIVKGNPNLEPERVLSYEAGITQNFGKRLNVRLTLYRAEVDDLIESRYLETLPGRPTYTLLQKDNISKVRAQGVEFETYYRIAADWTGYFNYTYNDSRITEDETNPELVDHRLAHSPLNKFNFGLTFDNPKFFTGTLQIRAVGDSYDDNENLEKLNSYWTLDLFLSKRLGRHFVVSVDFENLLDKRYDIPSFSVYKSPGFLWSTAVTMEF